MSSSVGFNNSIDPWNDNNNKIDKLGTPKWVS